MTHGEIIADSEKLRVSVSSCIPFQEECSFFFFFFSDQTSHVFVVDFVRYNH